MIQAYAPTYPVFLGATYMALGASENAFYFAGRLVGRASAGASWYLGAVSTDGIGTARWDNSLGGVEAWFYPWGEERGAVTANDRVKWGTYRRDSESSLDYGGNRYYSSVTGRFMSPDPYMANSGGAGDVSDPQSWNRYAYTRGDPVGRFDPWGTCDTSGDTDTSVTVCADSDPGENGGPVKVADSGTGLGDSHRPPGGGGGLHLSKDCLDALKTAGQNSLAVQRALNARSTLVTAVQGTSISWTMLAAIGVRESGFLNVSEVDGAGVGVGIFQITVGANSGVTAQQAGNLAWASNWAASYLATNNSTLAADYPNLDPAHLLQATAASYNLGVGGISGNPNTIDVGSALGNYGSSILGLMECFH